MKLKTKLIHIDFPDGLIFEPGGWINFFVGKRKGCYYLWIKNMKRRNFLGIEKINVKMFNDDTLTVNIK